MSRKEKIDLFLNKWVSRKLIVFVVASVSLFLGGIDSDGWVTISTAYIGIQGFTDIVEKLKK